MPTGVYGEEPTYRNFRMQLDSVATEVSTGTAAAGAVTVNDTACKITTEALTTAQNGVYTLTLTNDKIAAADIVLVTVGNGTNSAGTPAVTNVTPAAGSVVINVSNLHASAVALNGTLKLSVLVIKAL